MISMLTQAGSHATLAVHRAPQVYITGGKGGVGKSLIALNLALELGARGLRVLLVDLDLSLSDQRSLLGIEASASLEHYFCGEASLRDCLLSAGVNVELLAGANGNHSMAQLSDRARARFLEDLASFGESYDLILCDGAAGIGADTLQFAAQADHVLLVTTPDPTALTDAYGLLKALHAIGESGTREVPTPEVLVNLAGSVEEAHACARRLSSVAERFLARSPKLAGWMPRSAALARSVREHRPIGGSDRAPADAILPRSCLQSLAGRLERLCGRSPTAQGVGKKIR